MERHSTILVLDGHDGVGKTTLASRLAKALGIAYVRPFGGAAGERMLRSAKQGDHAQTSILAKSAVEHVIESTDASVLVCDRHWMTVFTLIPESYWQDWFPLPPTTLCWIDLETTINRLGQREEKQHDLSHHQYYLRLYAELGHRFNCHLLRTDQMPIQASLNHLIHWASSYVTASRPLGGANITPTLPG